MTAKQVSPLLSYDEGVILGRGSFSFVYLGFLKDNSKTVAVKRIQNSESETHSIQWEVELMQRADGHLNILRYICTEKDDYFR